MTIKAFPSRFVTISRIQLDGLLNIGYILFFFFFWIKACSGQSSVPLVEADACLYLSMIQRLLPI